MWLGANGGAWGKAPRTSAAGARIDAPREVGVGVPFPPGKGLWRGLSLSQKNFRFLNSKKTSYGVFWD